MTTTLQIRVDERIKKEAKQAFADMGLDISAGVNLYLTRVAETQAIPFSIFSFNNLTKKQKVALAKDEEYARTSKGYKTAEELHRSILK